AVLARDAVAARAPHRRGDEIATREPVAVLVYHAEELVAEHERRRIHRRDAEVTLVDLAIRPADTDLEHTHADTVALGSADLRDAARVRDARLGDERLHQGCGR